MSAWSPSWGLPGSSDGKESACTAGDPGSVPGLGRFFGEGNGKPTPMFLPGESHGQRSLAGYSPWGRKELDMTEMSAVCQIKKKKFPRLFNHFVVSRTILPLVYLLSTRKYGTQY